MSGRHRATTTSSLERFAVNRSGATLMLIGLIDSIGTGLYLAGSAIYFTQIVGLSTAQVGVGLSVAGLLGFVCQPPLGWLADRFGPRRLLTVMNVVRTVGFVAYVFVDGFPTFLLVAALLGIPEQAVSPVHQALVERVVGAKNRLAFVARTRAIYNVGFTVGALLATFALSIGTRRAFDSMFVANAMTCLFAAMLLPRIKMIAAAADGRSARRRLSLTAIRDLRYLAVAGTNGILALHMSMLSIAVPLWTTTHTEAPPSLVGPLLVVNTVLAITLQVRATRGTDTAAGGARALRRAAGALALTCLFLIVAAQLSTFWAAAVLVAAMMTLTAGELFQSAGGWALSYHLAPQQSRAEYLATFNLGASAQFVARPPS